MTERFSEMLLDGGHANSLGRVNEVIEMVLGDKTRLDELYGCMFNDDAWVRMRAADALEKICRVHPDWLLPYVDRFQSELFGSAQPSVQWHLAQIYARVTLTDAQRRAAQDWLRARIATTEVDWIVAANAIDTLMKFTEEGTFPAGELTDLLQVQQQHRSNAVVKRATKALAKLQGVR